MNSITVADLAAQLGGVVVSGDGSRLLSGVSTPEHAGPSDVIFVSSGKHREQLRTSAAAAVLLAEDFETPEGMAVIRVAHPMRAMGQAVDLLVPPVRRPAGISARAILGDDTQIAGSASIGPGVCVGDHTTIGDRTEIHAGVTIGANVVIGDDCILYSGVHIYDGVHIGHRVILHAGSVIGADGFGFIREPMPPGSPADEPFRHRKLRQVGTVVIEDDVEIGANTTIDRATLSETRVGRGTKIDNLVMVGHNSIIGRHSIIVSQAGLSGSVTLGHYATIAGQAGLIGHVHIGDHAVVGSQAGVTRDVPPHSTVLGAPAVDVKIAYKALPIIAHLPELRRLVRTLERRVTALEGGSSDATGDTE